MLHLHSNHCSPTFPSVEPSGFKGNQKLKMVLTVRPVSWLRNKHSQTGDEWHHGDSAHLHVQSVVWVIQLPRKTTAGQNYIKKTKKKNSVQPFKAKAYFPADDFSEKTLINEHYYAGGHRPQGLHFCLKIQLWNCLHTLVYLKSSCQLWLHYQI